MEQEYPVVRYCLQCSKYILYVLVSLPCKDFNDNKCPNCFSSNTIILFVDKPHFIVDYKVIEQQQQQQQQQQTTQHRRRRCLFRKMVNLGQL